jgi:hypothetical protein
MRKLYAVTAAIAGTLIVPFVFNGPKPTAQAMTCTSDQPIAYACDAAFYVVGSACHGQLPTKPPKPPIVITTAASINLCPPLG